MRIGIGYDIHALAPKRKLWLGGVLIPSRVGLRGHSDADVLLHAVIDAILGAMGESDIGEWFSDKDPRWKDASSVLMLRKVMERMRQRHFWVVNADTVIVAERPALGPFKEKIRRQLAGFLGVDRDRVGVKAKTNEGFDAVGRGKAISAQCVVLLRSKKG